MTLKKEKNPTPYLIPNSKNQHFTVEQTKLLDQITLEITEAWAKDLKNIRETYRSIKNSIDATQNLQFIITSQFPKLDEFLGKHSFILDFKRFSQTLENIDNVYQDLRKDLNELITRTEFARIENFKISVKELVKKLELQVNNLEIQKQINDDHFFKIHKALEEITNQINRKPWWKKILS